MPCGTHPMPLPRVAPSAAGSCIQSMTKPDPLRRFLYRLPLLLDRAGHTVATSRYTSDVRREQSLDVRVRLSPDLQVQPHTLSCPTCPTCLTSPTRPTCNCAVWDG